MAAEDFPRMLKRRRNERDWTLREMAGRAGVHFAYLSQIEAGVAKPSPELIEKLADAFGLKGQEREQFVFEGLGVRQQIQQIREKFPNLSAEYFRTAPGSKKR